MPEVKHRVANVTSYGLQGSPISLTTDLSVLGPLCTEPGANPRSESKDRIFRPLGYFSGKLPERDTSLPAFFPPFSYASMLCTGGSLETDQIQKNKKSETLKQAKC